MPYLACVTFPDTEHVRDAIMALEQYGVPSSLCSVLWLQQRPAAENQELERAAAALAPVASHATADGPIGTAGSLDPPLGAAVSEAASPPAAGWLARLLAAEGVPEDQAQEIERRVLAGEVLLTVRAEGRSAALDQLLEWTGARPVAPFAPFDLEASAALPGTEGRARLPESES